MSNNSLKEYQILKVKVRIEGGNMIEKPNEISSEQKAAIFGDLEKIAQTHNLTLRQLSNLIKKETEGTISIEDFPERKRDILSMKSYVGQRFLSWAVDLLRAHEDFFKIEKEFNGLCKKYKIDPPQNRQEAENFIGKLDQIVEKKY